MAIYFALTIRDTHLFISFNILIPNHMKKLQFHWSFNDGHQFIWCTYCFTSSKHPQRDITVHNTTGSCFTAVLVTDAKSPLPFPDPIEITSYKEQTINKKERALQQVKVLMERNTLTYMCWCKDDSRSHQALVDIKALMSQMTDEQETAFPPIE